MSNFTKIGLVTAAMSASIMLSGCAQELTFGLTKPNFDTAFTVSAELSCDSLTAKADITRVEENDWRFTFTEPQSLSGITLELGERVRSGSLGNIAFEAGENADYAMLPEIIAAAVNSLSNCTSEDIVQNDDILTYETEYNGKKVTVTANAKTGSLISLKCPYYKLSTVFSNQTPYVEPIIESDENTGDT